MKKNANKNWNTEYDSVLNERMNMRVGPARLSMVNQAAKAGYVQWFDTTKATEYQSRVQLFAYQHEDRPGLAGELLAQSTRYGTSLESARSLVHGSKFYGDIVITGREEDIAANVSDAFNRRLFIDPVQRIDMPRHPYVSDVIKRRQLIVTTGDEEEVVKVAKLPMVFDINIAYCDAWRRSAPEGVSIIETVFHMDVPMWELDLFDAFIDELIDMEDRGDVNLISRTWDLE